MKKAKTNAAPAHPTTLRHAVAVDDKAGLLTRLRRIEGQVRGVQQMIEDERYCPEVLAQIGAVESALKGVSRALVKSHLRHCATHALQSGDEAERERMIRELVDILGRG
jgi:DNA-binding FrmR family transcriptional regulator